MEIVALLKKARALCFMACSVKQSLQRKVAVQEKSAAPHAVACHDRLLLSDCPHGDAKGFCQ